MRRPKVCIHNVENACTDIFKAGLLGLTTAMSVSLQHYGIRVNAISPGRVKATHENKNGDTNGDQWESNDNDKSVHTSNRPGMPEDITEAAEYMLGAGFVNGENITVDGEYSNRRMPIPINT